jgi:hypothetical protein
VFRRKPKEIDPSPHCFFCGQATTTDEETDGGLVFMTLISAADQQIAAWVCHGACVLKARHDAAEWVKNLDVGDLRGF